MRNPEANRWPVNPFGQPGHGGRGRGLGAHAKVWRCARPAQRYCSRRLFLSYARAGPSGDVIATGANGGAQC